jgi:hypothetical protein
MAFNPDEEYMITIKQLPQEAITRLSEIDRSEKIGLITGRHRG